MPGPSAKDLDDANAYAGLKRKLAGSCREDPAGYTQGKSGFVSEILRRRW